MPVANVNVCCYHLLSTLHKVLHQALNCLLGVGRWDIVRISFEVPAVYWDSKQQRLIIFTRRANVLLVTKRIKLGNLPYTNNINNCANVLHFYIKTLPGWEVTLTL